MSKERIHRYNIERVLLERRILTPDSHWLYSKSTDDRGYGTIKYEDKYERVHRLAAMLWLGYKLDDASTQVNHKRICSWKRCFNPEHIYLGSQSENKLDSVAVGTDPNSVKTHCPRGHEYTEENTRMSNNRRHCRQCDKEKPWRQNAYTQCG